MLTFADAYLQETIGQLVMFDRVIFKGYLSGLYPVAKQFDWFLYRQNVLLKDFKEYAKQTTEKLKAHLQKMGEAAGCSIEYLPNGRGPKGESKEELAQMRLLEKNHQEGLIAIFSALELKNCFTVRGNHKTHKLEPRAEQRKCLHYYLYFNDAEFGLMYARIQSWWPFEIQIYLNGHTWLARQMDKAGIEYVQYDNCFLEIADLEAAQKLCHKFAHRKWERLLNNFAKRLNPWLPAVQETVKQGYYWTVEQCEIATDVMFTSTDKLDELLPELFQETLLITSAEDVMRFLGRKLSPQFQGKVESKLNKRREGWRIKHWVKQNSLKMYNKGSVLRVETTINNSGEFKIPNSQGKKPRWKRMPKGIAWFWHFYNSGKEANQRYLNSLSHISCQGKTALDALDSLCRSQEMDGRPIAKFQPISPETCRLFQAVLNSKYALTGFRNRHIRQELFGETVPHKETERRLCARVSRLLRKLRGHGLIERVKHSHLYRVTDFGYQAMSAALRYRYVEYPSNFASA